MRVMACERREVIGPGGRTYSYTQFCRGYVCEVCGGRPVEHHRFDTEADASVHWVQCGDCANRETFITQYMFEKQKHEAREVEEGLPAHLRALLREEPEPCQSETGRTDDLYV